jgi:hypothetical protein
MVLFLAVLLVLYSRRKGKTTEETQREQSRSTINKPWTPSQILVRSKIQKGLREKCTHGQCESAMMLRVLLCFSS